MAIEMVWSWCEKLEYSSDATSAVGKRSNSIFIYATDGELSILRGLVPYMVSHIVQGL